MTKMIKLLGCGLIALGILSLSGCNTVSGFGKDVSASGKAITKTADKAK